MRIPLRPLLLPLTLCAGLATTPVFAEKSDAPSHRAFAESFLQPMRLSNPATTPEIVEATVIYLTQLEGILDVRAERLAEIEADAGALTDEEADAAIVEAYNVARARYYPLRDMYVGYLEERLTPFHVERVKDGLTHNIVPKLEALYFEMVPDLRPTEKAHILGLLVELRENTMLASDREGQEQWVDKYRGIINNYIARQGYDFSALSKAWNAANPDADWAH